MFDGSISVPSGLPPPHSFTTRSITRGPGSSTYTASGGGGGTHARTRGPVTDQLRQKRQDTLVPDSGRFQQQRSSQLAKVPIGDARCGAPVCERVCMCVCACLLACTR
eukprot:GHVU01232984.1.p2 GENE.GHVU01232984.1~~GHVU01232984.1.p2  ORF type:complete len:108 (+),score=10.27 GHVU01232984.1:207-530(+)